MKTKVTSLLKASAVAVALVGSAAVVATMAMPDAAFAKPGNGNGGGKGNGGGNAGGNGGDKGNAGNSGGKSKGVGFGASKKEDAKIGGLNRGGSKSKKGKGFSLKGLLGIDKSGGAKSKAGQKKAGGAQKAFASTDVETSVRPKVRAKGNKAAALLGAHPSELGALNAANASETALLNASPNSRVGRIAIYRDTVLAGQQLEEDLAIAEGILAGLDEPERTVSEIEPELEAAETQVQEDQQVLADLEQDLIDAGGTDPDIENAIEQAEADLQASQDAADALAEERQEALDFEQAVNDVETLNEAIEEQPELERAALEDAANKPVTDEVETAVKALLGLE